VSSTPLVSVVIPAWNAHDTLERTLRSAAAQTYSNFEIVIVDDGSTDATAEIAQRFCADHANVRLLQQANAGVAAARNLGIAQARGEWVAPLDADDLWHPTKLARQVAAALAAPERPGFVYCWYQVIDEEDRVLSSGPEWRIAGRAFAPLLYCNPVENGSSLLIWRQAALEIEGYDPGLRARGAEGCEDLKLQLQIARNWPVELAARHLVGYRKRAGSMSRNTDQIIRSWNLVYDDLAADPHIPRAPIRWNRAFFARVRAEEALTRGSARQAFGQLGRALVLDPVKWASYLAYRAVRTAVRLARNRSAPSHRPKFSEVDPGQFLNPDPNEVAVLARLMRRLDERRLESLARRPVA